MAVLLTSGRQWTIDKMRETIAAGVKQQYIGWGTGGATAEAIGNTGLTTPSAEARIAGAITSPSAALHRLNGTLTSASSQNVSEVVQFDATTVGVPFLRAIFTAVPLLAGDAIAFTLDFSQL